MKAKTKTALLLSLRCKFKDTNTVEITIIDSATNEIWATRWKFRDVDHSEIQEKEVK